jgi:iron complex outermembrane receptor protein
MNNLQFGGCRCFLLAAMLIVTPTLGLAGETAAEEPDAAQTVTQTPGAGKKVFSGAITVTDRPIFEGNEVDRYGSIVARVSDAQIDDLHAQDLSAALRRVPGVVISRYNRIGAYGGGDGGAVFIRGHGSGRPGAEIATLTDGVPRFVGIWTHPLLDPLSVDYMGSVDVYRSAQPVLLGNMSFGALDMNSKRRLEPGRGGRFVGSYGSDDTIIGELEYGGRSDRVDYYLTASHRQSDGHRPNADGEVQALSGRVGVRLSEVWDLSLLVQHSEGDVNDPGMVGAPAKPIVENYNTDGDFVLATLSHGAGAWSGHVKLYYDDLRADWRQWDGAAGEQFNSLTDSANYGVRIRETVTPWAAGELVLGLDHDIYGGEFVELRASGNRSATDLDFRNTAPYLMLSHAFGGEVTVTPSVGLRYNDSRFFGGEWGGQAGVKIGFTGHAVYANYARAFNLPGVYAAVLYGGWGRGDQWRELEAETVDHLELGWLAALGNRVRLDISVFRDEVDNAIRFVPPPPPPPQFANIGAYEVQGIEFSLQAELAERLGVFIGGTYNDPTPTDVPNLPETTMVGGVSWATAGGFRLNADAEWVDDRYVLNPRFAPGQAPVDGYLLVNGRAGVPLRWLGLGVEGEIFVTGENLGDEDYEYRIGYPMPGRSWNLGVDLRF